MKTPQTFPVVFSEGFAHATVYRSFQKNGTPVYSLQYWLGGKRHRQAFADWAEAKTKAESIVKKLAAGDAAALALTGDDQRIYLRSVETLKPTGIALDSASIRFAEAFKVLGSDMVLEACKEYARRHPRNMPKRTVAEVATELVEAKRKANRSERHVKDLESRCGAFAAAFVNTQIQAITPGDVRRYLEGKKIERPSRKGKAISARSFKNNLNSLTNFFEFAKSRGYLPKDFDAMDGIELPDDRGGEIEIFTPRELALMLQYAPAEFVPFIALGAFAGIRSAEAERLDWSDIRPDFVEVKASKAKTASRRLVPICPALSAWLEPYRQPAGPVIKMPCVAFVLFKVVDAVNAALEAQADGKPFAPFKWLRNALRHSHISYRMAQIQDVGKVSLEAGNSAQMIFQHYRELVTPAEAAAWFSVTPNRPANVVAINQAATA